MVKIVRRQGKAPKTPRNIRTPGLEPSLTQILGAAAAEEKKFFLAPKSRDKDCPVCRFWHGHCGLVSMTCVNKPERPLFMAKSDVEI